MWKSSGSLAKKLPQAKYSNQAIINAAAKRVTNQARLINSPLFCLDDVIKTADADHGAFMFGDAFATKKLAAHRTACDGFAVFVNDTALGGKRSRGIRRHGKARLADSR